MGDNMLGVVGGIGVVGGTGVEGGIEVGVGTGVVEGNELEEGSKVGDNFGVVESRCRRNPEFDVLSRHKNTTPFSHHSFPESCHVQCDDTTQSTQSPCLSGVL